MCTIGARIIPGLFRGSQSSVTYNGTPSDDFSDFHTPPE
jgi:hypothetical protein